MIRIKLWLDSVFGHNFKKTGYSYVGGVHFYKCRLCGKEIEVKNL